MRVTLPMTGGESVKTAVKTLVTKLRAGIPVLTVAALVATSTVATAQSDPNYSEDGWRPKENFWWLFAAYAVIWIALFGYVARMASRQQQLERELKQLEREQPR